MSLESYKLRKLQYYIEPSTAYATSVSGTVAYKDIKCLEDTANLELIQEMVDNKTMAQRLDDFQPKINTRKRCNVSFTSYLNGSGTAASKGVMYGSTPNGDILKTIMGGEHRTTGSGVTTITSAGQFIVDSLANDLLYAGTVVGVLNPSTNQIETARIANYNTATNEIYLTHQLGFTPVSGATVYGSANYYFTQDPTNSLQFHVVGANTNDTWVACGLNGGFSLKTELGQLPEISYKFDEGATWITGSTETLDVVSYTDATPPALVDGFVKFYPRGANATSPAAQSLIDVAEIEISPAIAYESVKTERGVNNISRKRRNRVTPVATAKIKTYFVDKTYKQALVNSTFYGLSLQLGTTAGNVIAIEAPYCKITKVDMVEIDGMVGQEITVDIMEDKISSTTSGQTDLCRSAFVLSIL